MSGDVQARVAAVLAAHEEKVGGNNRLWRAECVGCGWSDHGVGGGMVAAIEAHRAHVAAAIAADLDAAGGDGAWVCAVCGEGGPAHGEHGFRRECAFQPIWRLTPSPAAQPAPADDEGGVR